MQAGAEITHEEKKDSASIRLQEAIRDLVREEVNDPKPPAASTKPKPTGEDVFWLFVVGANAALALWVLPEAFLDDKRFKSLVEMVQWFGSYMFVLGYAWLKDWILNLNRERWFRVVLGVALVVLVPARLTGLPIVRLHPRIVPEKATVYVDTEPDTRYGKDDPTIRVSLREHKFTIKDPSQNIQSPPITLGVFDIIRCWRGDPVLLYWPLLVEVHVTSTAKAEEVAITIASKDGFDPSFLSKLPAVTGGSWEASGKDNTATLLLHLKGQEEFKECILSLPYGKYTLIQSCSPPESIEITVPDNAYVLFESPCTQK